MREGELYSSYAWLRCCRISLIILLFVVQLLPLKAQTAGYPGPAIGHNVREILNTINENDVANFNLAWTRSYNGNANVECAVLIYRLHGSAYSSYLASFTNQRRQISFKWDPRIAAIVHTHPNDCDPAPSVNDRRIANDKGIPIFTITRRGLFVYDPHTRQVTHLMQGLDWLVYSNWQRLGAPTGAPTSGRHTN